MAWSSFVYTIAFAAQLAAQDSALRDPSPPVLRGAEPSDNTVITLPGVLSAPPPASATVQQAAEIDETDHRPLLRRAPKPVFPAEFERDSAVFTQKWIGLWAQPDAYNLFGEPLRERITVDDAEKENGRVYAFSDPTGRYREVELDFAKADGLLRTVFVYPWKMKWEECRKQWGANVHSTEANKGRTFYSYVNRRVDVLVDRNGNVISFGLY